MRKQFREGLLDGLPICLGYLSVSFAFGIFAVSSGLGVFETLLLSMTNVTSAGQFAAVPLIAGGGALLELAAVQMVINARYALMGVSLSQAFGADIRQRDRFLLAFVNTDEVFAVATSNGRSVSRAYMYGLILLPYLGWSLGTLLGASAGDILPRMLVSALGVAIYGMFVAIVVPGTKKNRYAALCVLLAISLRCLFYYVPQLGTVPDGVSIILCAVVAAAVAALCAPIAVEEAQDA